MPNTFVLISVEGFNYCLAYTQFKVNVSIYIVPDICCVDECLTVNLQLAYLSDPYNLETFKRNFSVFKKALSSQYDFDKNLIRLTF